MELVTYGNVSWIVVWTMIIQNERRFFDTVDYYVELLLFVLVSCKTTLPPTTETESTLIKSFNFEDSLQSLYAWMPVLQIPKNGRLTLFYASGMDTPWDKSFRLAKTFRLLYNVFCSVVIVTLTQLTKCTNTNYRW